ncbi:MAG: 50S ribosomal protein L22 [Bacteroidia bacterium]|nr:50S ribosomal protein L22 [Bacteroidia bacterium]
MKAVAKLRNIPMSARKMRLVVNNIRGKDVDDALDILKFTNKESSIWLEKLLLSAISNWENKLNMAYNADDYGLVISKALVDEGSALKRFRPAPQGRAHRIRKRQNHVTLIVENTIAIEGLSEEEE